jgi:hypothetical protein
MCGLIFAFWLGRHNNRPIEERTDVVRESNVNTRVVKLSPLNKKEDTSAVNDGTARGGVADGEANAGENASLK